MIPGSDTAKQDLLLIVGAGIAIFLFFWFYAGHHPLRIADNSVGEAGSRNISTSLLHDWGYRSDFEPNTTFRSNNELLDSLQKETDFHSYYDNSLNKSLTPVFYWNNQFGMGGSEEQSNFFPPFDNQKTIELQISEAGKFIAFRNNNQIIPDDSITVNSYNPVLDSLLTRLTLDESGISSFEFQITPGRVTGGGSDVVVNGGRVQFSNRQVLELAGYYLEQSGWPERYFEVSQIDSESWGEKRVASVRYYHDGSFTGKPVNLGVKILPNGKLVSFNYSFEMQNSGESSMSVAVSGIRILLILVGVFWIVILFFIRFRLRLIDLKAATLVAVLAGIVVPFLIYMELLYGYLSLFGEVQLIYIFTLLIPAGFMAALTTLVFFAVTAIADSITRKAWSDKLRTTDLFRMGHLTNVPFGVNIIRGVSYGFILAAIWVMVTVSLPDSYISLSETVFEADNTFLPYITQLLGNGIVVLLIAEIVFLIFVSQLKSVVKSPVLLTALPAAIFAVVHPFTFDIGPIETELISAGVIGLAAGWIFYKEDYITLFISLLIFLNAITSAQGWVIQNSPDSLIFYSFILFTAVGFIFGGVNIIRGASTTDLPNFVPEYVRELAQEDRIKQELQIAREVQQSFLPVKTPKVEGLDIYAICKPAYETGGDYYDFIELDDGSVAVVIGDVSGKGIQAAFFMTFTKGIIHSLCNDFRSSIDVLVRANKLFRQNSKRGTFISLIFGIIKPGGDSFCFSRAGHNPLLYYESKTDSLKEFKPQGLAIGMADETTFKKHIAEERIQLSKNDILVLFTDGVVESVSKTNKVYGDNRLYNLIKQNSNLSSREIVTKIHKDLQHFEDQSEQHDDMTMIVIKKK